MQEVEKIIAEIMRIEPVRIKKMTYGEMNKVYDVLLPNNQGIIFRANDITMPLEGTKNNIGILSELGLPVPKVLHADVSKSKYPFAYIILEKIPGRDLRFELPHMSRQQISDLATEIVKFQKKVMTLRHGSGFGFAAINKKANSKSWAELIDWDLTCGLPHIEDVVGEEGIVCIKEQAIRYAPYFGQVKPECFLDDITIKNVIMLNGKLQGIIDLDWVCYGDFLTMLGLTQALIIADVGYEDLTYFEELCYHWDITKEQREIVDFYSLIHATKLISLRRNNNEVESVGRLEESIKRWVLFQSKKS